MPRTPVQVGRVLVPKASDLLADRIREKILAGTIAEGQPLPSERELVVETGLGRSTIREAIRILENQGLVVTRTGRHGGTVARRPGRTTLEESISTFIRGQQLRLEALLEARAAVEPAAARYAALHRSEVDLAHLDAAQIKLSKAVEARDLPAYLVANVEWHLGVVQASHNELLIAFMAAISQAVHTATEADTFNSDAVQTATLRIHARVVDAIVKRDAEAAERRMRRHVQAYVDLVGSATAGTQPNSKRRAKEK